MVNKIILANGSKIIPNFHKKQSLSCIHYTKSSKVKLQLDTKVDIRSYRILLNYMQLLRRCSNL
jgi:hypothetical protein